MKRRGFLASLFALPAAAKAVAESKEVTKAVVSTFPSEPSEFIDDCNLITAMCVFSSPSGSMEHMEPPFFTEKFKAR